MKICPNCKAELDENARFCLRCMTSLDEKEQIQPPIHKPRRWGLALLCFLCLTASLIAIVILRTPTKQAEPSDAAITETPAAADDTETIPKDTSTISHTVDGITYTFRSATEQDHPTAISLSNYFVLVRVEGTPANGIYCVPSFVGGDTSALVVAVADGAFAGTRAEKIDLGYTVRYVWGNAFGGYALTDLYLHGDVLIDQAAFSGCTRNLTVHCPEYLENTEGVLWSDLAADYGFHWQNALL